GDHEALCPERRGRESRCLDDEARADPAPAMSGRRFHRLVPATPGGDDDPAAADDLARARNERDIPRPPPCLKELPQPCLPPEAEGAVVALVVDGIAAGDLQLEHTRPQLAVAEWLERQNLDLPVLPLVRPERPRFGDQAHGLFQPIAACLQLLPREP